MTVLGCDCDARVCTFVSETPPQWSSIDDCKSAGRAAILRHSELNYPLVTVECRVSIGATASSPAIPSTAEPTPVAPTTALAEVAVSTNPESSDRTNAIYSGLVSSSRFVLRKTSDGYAYVGAGVGVVADGAIKLMRQSVVPVLASE